jgi:hypothetical protein
VERPCDNSKQGRLLIVSLQPGSAKVPLHYVVVTGIDWRSGAVLINDPARGKLLRIERAEFEKNGGRTAIGCCWRCQKGPRDLVFWLSLMLLSSPVLAQDQPSEQSRLRT